ncbi:exported hypothetical protein [Mesorhizobium plurifarium]|uniref:Uncharacterized protein n=1 Tax=Mesorhizobium plurifarium TaxID=69974 RepID=A0A090EEX3_MESPL|nr:exported hypothetical protein [Mesorhizobium plurifarium]
MKRVKTMAMKTLIGYIACMVETFTFSSVSFGSSDDRTIVRHVPFTVDGVAATRISEGEWAYRLLPHQCRVTITEISSKE